MKKLFVGTLAVSFLLAAVSARADRYDRRWHQAHWGEGHWIHDRHAGQLGWWWVIGDDWHFYAHPVAQPNVIVVQQNPAPPVVYQQVPAPQQTVIMAQPPAMVPPPAAPVMAPPVMAAPITPTMYYCRATGTYYPETMSCPNGWSPVVAGQPPAP